MHFVCFIVMRGDHLDYCWSLVFATISFLLVITPMPHGHTFSKTALKCSLVLVGSYKRFVHSILPNPKYFALTMLSSLYRWNYKSIARHV